MFLRHVVVWDQRVDGKHDAHPAEEGHVSPFRQAVYEHGLTKARDSQFELLDALLLSRAVRSFPGLTSHPVFRRQWHSAYTAIEDGDQNGDWLEETFHHLSW
jgi:hypothetical protein